MRFLYYENQIFEINHHYERSKNEFKKNENYILIKEIQIY